MKKLLFITLTTLLIGCKKEQPTIIGYELTFSYSAKLDIGGVKTTNIYYFAKGMSNLKSAEIVNQSKNYSITLQLKDGNLIAHDNAAYGTGKNIYYFKATKKDNTIEDSKRFECNF